jgi:hypothetical protein
VEATDRTSASRDELVMTTRQQSQHLAVIFQRNDAQIAVP